MTLVLNIPSGWQFSLGNFSYRGFIQLDKGIKSEHATNYSFEGQPGTGSFSDTKSGPFADEYVYHDTVGLMPQIWSPCTLNRALNVNTSVRVYNANKTAYSNVQGYITNDSIDGEIHQEWGISWRKR